MRTAVQCGSTIRVGIAGPPPIVATSHTSSQPHSHSYRCQDPLPGSLDRHQKLPRRVGDVRDEHLAILAAVGDVVQTRKIACCYRSVGS